MPFQSEKQRRFLHANHPEIAKRWERDYAHGGILDINESEEIISDDGNEIELTDYNATFDDPTGVKSLFRAKKGGQAIGGGTITGEPRGDRTGFGNPFGYSDAPAASSSSSSSGGGDAGHLSHNVPQSLGGTKPSYQTVHDTGAISQTPYYDPTVPPQLGGESTVKLAVDVARTDFETKKAQLEKKLRNTFVKKILGAVLGGGITLGLSDLKTAKTMYDLAQVQKDYIKLLENAKTQYKKQGLPEFNPHVDTAIQTLDQEILDLTQRPDRDEDRGGDGGPEPIYAPVTGAVDEEYAQGDFDYSYGMSDLDRIRAGQAKRAMINPEWQELFGANKGGLANLFRVKNK